MKSFKTERIKIIIKLLIALSTGSIGTILQAPIIIESLKQKKAQDMVKQLS